MRIMLFAAMLFMQAQAPIGYVPVKPKPLWKATKLSTATVLITCPSGEIPEVNAAKGMTKANWVMVTCNR